jgi:CheY-like chemotaxis protein
MVPPKPRKRKPVLKILIIDDDPAGTQLLITLLGIEGYQGYKPDDWHDPLGDVERQHPDLIIIDVHLRTWDGIELLSKIRTHPNPSVAGTPVLMMSAEDYRARSRSAGANAFVEKPFDRSTLLDAIQQITGGRLSNN